MKSLLQKILPKLIGVILNLQSLFNQRGAAKRAFTIFGTPRKGRILPEQKPFLEPHKGAQIKIPETALFVQTYHWKGTGPTVLLVHGWESNAHRWWKFIPQLQEKNYNIIAFDAPVHGASNGTLFSAVLYAEAIHAVASHFKPEYQVAHSIGGLSSLLYYRDKQPEHLQKLVVLGSASDLVDIMDGYQKMLGFNNRVLNALEKLINERFGFEFRDFSGAAFAKAVHIPGLVIHDTLDPITPVKASRDIHKNWPQSTYIETKGLGHSLYQDEVRQHILNFLEA